jgi:DNA-binding response OmpR family regulator
MNATFASPTARTPAAIDVLVVDDERDLLMAIGEYLQCHGFSVLTALDTEGAMRHLGESRISLVVLDVKLAGEDGLKLLDFIKLTQPSIPVVLFTGMPHDQKQVQDLLLRGATCYVDKSQSPEALVYAIREARRQYTLNE